MKTSNLTHVQTTNTTNNSSEEYQDMQWQHVEQQLTSLIEHEEVIKLAALCCQIGDAFIQQLVVRTLFGTQTLQQLEQIETQLTEDITSALLHQNSEKKQTHEKDRNHRLQPLRRTLTFQGSPHYVQAMIAYHEQPSWLAQTHQTTNQSAEEKSTPPLSQQAQDALSNTIKQSLNTLISDALMQCATNNHQGQLLISDLDMLATFRWLMSEHKMGIKAVNQLLNPALLKLTALFNGDEIQSDRPATGETKQASLVSLLRTGLIERHAVNHLDYVNREAESEMFYHSIEKGNKVVRSKILNIKKLTRDSRSLELSKSLLSPYLHQQCVNLIEIKLEEVKCQLDTSIYFNQFADHLPTRNIVLNEYFDDL
jgi:hypothetical protein